MLDRQEGLLAPAAARGTQTGFAAAPEQDEFNSCFVHKGRVMLDGREGVLAPTRNAPDSMPLWLVHAAKRESFFASLRILLISDGL